MVQSYSTSTDLPRPEVLAFGHAPDMMLTQISGEASLAEEISGTWTRDPGGHPAHMPFRGEA